MIKNYIFLPSVDAEKYVLVYLMLQEKWGDKIVSQILLK